MTKKLIYLLFFFTFWLWQLQAQNITNIGADDFKKKYHIDNAKLRFFYDSKGKVPFKEVLKKDFKNFSKIKENFKPFQTYWVELNLRSYLDRDTEWILFLGFVTNAQIYVLHEDGSFEKKVSGIFVPNAQLDPNEGEIPKARVLLRADSKTQVYIRFENSLAYPPELDLALQPHKSWQRTMNQTNYLQGIFQGLLFMIFLYNFFLYLSIGDRTYLYYVLYVLFISLYFSNQYEYLEEYLLPYSPVLSFHLDKLVYIAMIFYIAFNRRFLKIPQNFPKWDIVMKFWLVISVLFALASFPLAYFAFDIYVPVRNYYHIFYVTLILVFVLIVLALAIRYRNLVAVLFIAGNLFVLAGGVCIILGIQGFIPFSLYYLIGGITLQIFIFSMALSFRFRKNIDEHQVLQKRLIKQLKENERLQEEITQNLEQKVRERTQEIEQKSEEIRIKNEELNIKNEKIEDTYNKITDSIRYAQRLQRAILGDEKEIVKDFDDGFVLYIPKDMVSGDFYWYAKLGSYKILIAADCTGHGIPGALMTILGNSILNDVILEERFTSPEHILEELDKKVVMTIQKQTSGQQPKDGMDMVILVLDENSGIARFAGAKNPLYLVRDDYIKQIKGSKYPIGIYNFKKQKQFDLHTFTYQKGDIFYLTSDGFQDQFGETGRKYLKKRFREYLLNISQLDMSRQKMRLYDEYDHWKGSKKQTDDILVIGIKV